jgi:hypothetical protein
VHPLRGMSSACPGGVGGPVRILEQILRKGRPCRSGSGGLRAVWRPGIPRNILRACAEIGFRRGGTWGGLSLYCEAVAFQASKGGSPGHFFGLSGSGPAGAGQVPALLENLVPVAPPFEITARKLKREGESPGDLCYVVPCPAKAWAATRPLTPEGACQQAIPLADLYNPLQACLHRMPGAPGAWETISRVAMEWAFPGGQGKALGREVALTVDGIHRVAEILELAENGLLDEVPFIEAWSCPGGCLGGCLNVRNPFWARFQLSSAIRKHFPPGGGSGESGGKKEEAGQYLLHQSFPPRAGMRLDENLQRAMEKLRRIDETVRLPGIDCGSCGSPLPRPGRRCSPGIRPGNGLHTG